MIVLLVLLHYACTGSTENIVILPGSSVCNETVLLSKARHAAIIDFRVSTFSLDPVNHFCSFHIETINTPYVGMKFLSTFEENNHSNFEQYSFELNITGKKMEQFHYSHFPDQEITVDTYGYITVKLKLANYMFDSNATTIFQLLVFKFGEVYCSLDESECINSTRCVNRNLTCMDEYDFCDNNFKNCKREYDHNNCPDSTLCKPFIPESGPSLGFISLVILVTFLLFIIACWKRSCFREMKQKLSCRSSSCRSVDNQGDDTIAVSAAASSETQEFSCTSHFREPPPRYSDIYSNNLEQTENGNISSETGSVFPYLQSDCQDIPPPFYSEAAGATETDRHELPPPYSSEATIVDNLHIQHF